MRYGVGSGRTIVRRTGTSVARARPAPQPPAPPAPNAARPCARGSERQSGSSASAARRSTAARRARRPAGRVPRRPRDAPPAAEARLERPHELTERVGCLGARAVLEGQRAPCAPRELGPATCEPGPSASICRSATRRRHSSWSSARRADACASCFRYRTSASRDVVAVGDPEQARPEVVVLALPERGVVAEPVLLEHRRSTATVEWKNGEREQGGPAHGARAPPAFGARVPSARRGPRSIIPVPTTATRAARRDAREDGVQPAGKRDVVCIHPRHVASPRIVETDVERTGEPERRVVPDDLQPRVGDRLQLAAGPVLRPVVDDDELQVSHRLAEDALHRLGDRRLARRVRRGRRTREAGPLPAGVACGGGGSGS